MEKSRGLKQGQCELSARQTQANAEISRNHGTALVRTLRAIYGAQFAPGLPGSARLLAVLDRLDEPSLQQLYRDHEANTLGSKISAQYF